MLRGRSGVQRMRNIGRQRLDRLTRTRHSATNKRPYSTGSGAALVHRSSWNDLEVRQQEAPEDQQRPRPPVYTSAMDSLTAFGLLAVTAMLVFYALEDRSPWFILAFAGACVLGSIYGFAQGAWPFGLVEAIWALVAVRRWWAAARP